MDNDYHNDSNSALSSFDFFEASILPKCVTDVNGIFVRVNKSYCELYEMSKEALLGQPFTIHFPQLDEESKRSLIVDYQEFIRIGKFDKGNFEVLRSDGQRITVEVVRQLINLEEETYVLSYLKDISRQHELTQALEQSESLLRRVFESIQQSNFIVDKDLQIVAANGTAHKQAGMIIQQSLAEGMHLSALAGDPHYDALLTNVKKAFAGEVIESVRDFRAGDETIYLQFVYEPLIDASGHVERVLIKSTDISQQVASEQELNRINRQLEETLNARQEQLYFITHDLRSPFNSILGIIELLEIENDKSSDPNLDMFLSYIRQMSEQGLDIIEQLSQVGRIEHGTLQPEFKKLDLLSLLHDVVKGHRTLADKKKQEILIIEETDEPIAVEGDYGMLYSVVANLLSNAIKYSPMRKTIRLTLSNSEHGASVEVKDEGPGLTAEDHAKLFGKFSRLSARPTANEKSSGLGLYIAKSLVNAHSGEITAESEGKNKGTTFRVQLPAQPHQKASYAS
jgi:PAS domain S-box-containing protein